MTPLFLFEYPAPAPVLGNFAAEDWLLRDGEERRAPLFVCFYHNHGPALLGISVFAQHT